MAPVFGSSSAITGPWEFIGDSPFPAGECPSLFGLPPLTHAVTDLDALPTHVYCRGYDRASFYVLGTFKDGATARDIGTWNQTGSVPFAQRRIDNGNIYASKDFLCPRTKRRILWSWATTQPASQTLPREVLYDPTLKQLIFRPVEELDLLHAEQPLAHLDAPLAMKPNSTHVFFRGGNGDGNASDVSITIAMPMEAIRFGVRVLGGGNGNEGSMSAYIDYVPPTVSSTVYTTRVGIDYSPKPSDDHGATNDNLQLLSSDKFLSLRVFTDRTVVEAYFQGGRVALTAGAFRGARSRGQISFFVSGGPVTIENATAWKMHSIWVDATDVTTALKNDEAAVSKKKIDWFTERCGGGDSTDTQAACDDAVKFATVTHPSLISGIMPCCNLLQIDCRTGILQFNTSEYNFSRFAPFIAAGKTVSVTLEGTGDMASCCSSADNCTMLENKEALAQQLLELALQYRLSSFTGDWEFNGQKLDFYWAGWNATMAHIAAVLKPHGIGIGNTIASDAESLDACARPGFPGGPGAPDWCPAYRNVPWADVLTDMSTYSLDDGSGDGTDVALKWLKNGTRGSCPYDPNNDPLVIQYCGGVESRVMNVLHSPIAAVYPDRAPQLSPGLYIGECLTNDTTRTKQGWTQPKLSEFLSFLDTQGITRIGLWCTNISPTSNATDPIGFPCPLNGCPWMLAELKAWKMRKADTAVKRRVKSDDAVVTFHKIPAFQKGAGGYAAYGIPSLLSFIEQLLVFAEGRRFSCSDSPGQHDLMCQRSTDGGKGWGNCTADSAALVDVSLEYGSTCAGKTTTCGTWDPTPVAEHSTGKVFVFFSQSPANNSGGTRTLMVIESDDLAHTFRTSAEYHCGGAGTNSKMAF